MSHRILSSILRHDAKQTSYKIALLRALNAVVLAYPELDRQGLAVAVPLRLLADHWIAYYWPFVDRHAPISQGVRSLRNGQETQDVTFRNELQELRAQWEAVHGSGGAADGFLVMDAMRIRRKRADLPDALVEAYGAAQRKIVGALRQPIQYAGPGKHAIFDRPRRLSDLRGATPLPGSRENDTCVVVMPEIWRSLRDVSLWVEALCVHEWSLFTERIDGAHRGEAYRLLTAQPESRLSLNWERNHVDVLLLEGAALRCPWTRRTLEVGQYDLDHIVPLSIYPINELWNLAPTDPDFNRNRKRDRLPSRETYAKARPTIVDTLDAYGHAPDLARALRDDVNQRFGIDPEPRSVAAAIGRLAETIGQSRNVQTF